MSQPGEQLVDHPVLEAAAQLRSAVEDLAPAARVAAEEVVPGIFDRLMFVADWATGLIHTIDPRLAPQPRLEGVRQHLAQITEWVRSVPGNPGVVANIPNWIDGAVEGAAGLALAIGPVPELTEQAGKRIGRSIGLRATRLSGELDDLQARLDGVRTDISEAQASAAQDTASQLAEQERRIEELASAIDTEKARVDQFVTTAVGENESQEKDRNRRAEAALKSQQQAFDDELLEARTEAEKRTNQVVAKVEAALGETRKRLNASKAQLDQQTEAILQEIQQRKADVDALHQATVQAGLSGAFATEANDQATAADGWRYATVFFGVIAVGIAIWIALDSPDKLTPEAVVAKLAVTLGFAALATYSATQSAQHRARESSAKALELDLAALSPFLEQLDVAQRTSAIESFVARWMAARASTPDQSAAFGATAVAEALLKAMPAGGSSGSSKGS